MGEPTDKPINLTGCIDKSPLGRSGVADAIMDSARCEKIIRETFPPKVQKAMIRATAKGGDETAIAMRALMLLVVSILKEKKAAPKKTAARRKADKAAKAEKAAEMSARVKKAADVVEAEQKVAAEAEAKSAEEKKESPGDEGGQDSNPPAE